MKNFRVVQPKSVKRTDNEKLEIVAEFEGKHLRKATRLARKISSLPPNRNSCIAREDENPMTHAVFAIMDNTLFRFQFICQLKKSKRKNGKITLRIIPFTTPLPTPSGLIAKGGTVQ